MIPEMKIRIFMQIITGLLLISTAYQIYSGSNSLSQSVFSFVLRGNWTRGFNLLSAAAIVLLILACVIFLFFKGLLVDILKNILDPKGITILRLVSSLIQYGVFIGLLFIFLNYLGINTTVMLAGFSAFSLAITLGGQGLVADILAGIFIIFEDDFHVGDLIDVNSGPFYKGIWNIGPTAYILSVNAECKEINLRKVRRKLNHAMIDLFEKYGFKMG